jgi:hypothetical protein
MYVYIVIHIIVILKWLLHVIRNIVIVILHAYIRIEFTLNLQTLMEEAKWKQLSNGRRHIGRHLVQKYPPQRLRKRSREFARTPAEVDLASGQNTACGLHAEALSVRSGNIHKDYTGKVAWVNAPRIWITYSLLFIEWYSSLI